MNFNLSFVIRRLSFVIRHLPSVICHLSFVIYHLSFVICHSSFVIYHSSFVICHSSFAICHSSFVICHSLIGHRLQHIRRTLDRPRNIRFRVRKRNKYGFKLRRREVDAAFEHTVKESRVSFGIRGSG